MADTHGTRDAAMLRQARRYIALSNQLTTEGMAEVFAADAVYESLPALGDGSPAAGGPAAVRLAGRDDVLRAHQAFFDTLAAGHWHVPEGNYRVTGPDTVEFDIESVTLTDRATGLTSRGPAHEVMVFDADGRARHVSGRPTAPAGEHLAGGDLPGPGGRPGDGAEAAGGRGAGRLSRGRGVTGGSPARRT